MNVEIGTVAEHFFFWEDLFQISVWALAALTTGRKNSPNNNIYTVLIPKEPRNRILAWRNRYLVIESLAS